MKLKLTYLFIFGLLFCKLHGYSSVAMPETTTSSTFQKFFKGHEAICIALEDQENNFPKASQLCVDDNDDDDYSYEKKKQPITCTTTLQQKFISIVPISYFLVEKSFAGQSLSYSFPPIFLLVRSIRV